MQLKINVLEVVSIFKEINEQPEELYEMIRADIRKTIGTTHFYSELRFSKIILSMDIA